jgi:regulatory protein
VIDKLKEQKFINDEEFAKWWIESRTTFKPRSLRLIKIELRQKGIDDETINNLQLTVNNDLEQAKELVEKRITRFRNKSKMPGGAFGMTREEIYQKLGRYLASKGFDWDTIKQSIDELIFK